MDGWVSCGSEFVTSRVVIGHMIFSSLWIMTFLFILICSLKNESHTDSPKGFTFLSRLVHKVLVLLQDRFFKRYPSFSRKALAINSCTCRCRVNFADATLPRICSFACEKSSYIFACVFCECRWRWRSGRALSRRRKRRTLCMTYLCSSVRSHHGLTEIFIKPLLWSFYVDFFLSLRLTVVAEFCYSLIFILLFSSSR